MQIWSSALFEEIKYFSNFGGKNENFSLYILDFDDIIQSILAFSMHRSSTQIRLKVKLKG